MRAVSKTLLTGRFKLTKISSNIEAAIADLKMLCLEKSLYLLESVLGAYLIPDTDTFNFDEPNILRIPIIQFTVMLQTAVQFGLHWDQPFPAESLPEIDLWLTSIGDDFSNIGISRHFATSDDQQYHQRLHECKISCHLFLF